MLYEERVERRRQLKLIKLLEQLQIHSLDIAIDEHEYIQYKAGLRSTGTKKGVRATITLVTEVTEELIGLQLNPAPTELER